MEIWKDIEKFPNYQASNQGNIRNKRTGHILKPSSDRYGYLKLSLGNVNNVPVHRLVCETFHGIPEEKKCHVNHIDFNRQNNNSDNLEWCTPKENVRWSYDHGNINTEIGLSKAREVNARPVRIIELDKVFSSAKECAYFLGVEPTNVSRCLRGSRKGQRLHGYHLEYVGKENDE